MAEKKVIELEIKAESVGSLKSELRKAQAEVAALSEKFGATSQEAINAAKKAAELKDAIGDAKALTDAFNPDAKFNALSASIGGVLNGFQAFEGALGLIGVESDSVQKALLNVQSAMALSQGVQGLMEAKDSFIQLKAVIGQTVIGQKALAVAEYAAAAAMKVLNTVMKANPIGLVIAAITALVGAIAFFTRETGNAKEAAEDYTKALENQRRAIDANFESLKKRQEERIALMEAQGATEQAIFEQEQKNTRKLADEKAKAHVKEKYSYQNLRRLYKQLMDQGDEEEAESIREQLKTSRERYNELQKQSKDYYHQIAYENKLFYAENKKKVEENEKKVAENAANIRKEAAEKEAERRKELADKERERREKELEEEKRLAEERAKFLLEQEALDEVRQEQAYARRLEENAKMLEEELAIEQAARERREAEEAAEEIRQEERFKREQERRTRNKEFAIDSAQQTLQLIADISSLFAGKSEKAAKRAFEIQKAVSIASATIDTYKSAVSAYQSQFLPIADVSSPIRGAVAAGIAVAAGLANVAKISAQKFEGGGAAAGGGTTSYSGGGGASSVVSPNFNIVGNAQATNPLAGLGGQPIQAYVVSGEVTTAQSLDRNRINYATFG